MRLENVKPMENQAYRPTESTSLLLASPRSHTADLRVTPTRQTPLHNYSHSQISAGVCRTEMVAQGNSVLSTSLIGLAHAWFAH